MAVLGATVAAFLIGFAWYSPLMFIKPWMKLQGLDPNHAGGKMPWGTVAIEAAFTLLTAFFIAQFAGWVGARGFMDGIMLGFYIWLAFYATSMLGPVLWERRPLNLYFINVSRWLVALLVMSVIITTWQ